MKRGDIVYENSNGKATYQWKKGNGNMYRIYRKDGHELWTNSMDIIKGFLKETKQLELWN